MLAHTTKRLNKVLGPWVFGLARGLHSTTEAAQSSSIPPPKPVPLSKLKDSFLDGTSSTYLEELEERYRQNPSSVDKTWASFFRSMGTFLLFSLIETLDDTDSILTD
jgi:hypothetical protein